MKKILSMALLVLALVHGGASAPRQKDTGDAAGNPKKSESNKASVSPQGFAANQILKFFGRKKDKDLMAGKESKNQKGGSVPSQGGESAPGLMSRPAVPGVPNATKASVLAVPRAFQLPSAAMAINNLAIPKVRKIERLVVPPPPVSRVAVPQIRHEIQKIFELNKKIKNVQNGGSVQLQRVQEQARIHQKILDRLEASQKQASGEKASAKDALLGQEKLRIIHEETLRNTQVIEDLKAAPASSAPKVTSEDGSQSDAESDSESGSESGPES